MRYLALVLGLALLVACTTTQPTPSSSNNFVVPTPVNGKAVVFGQVLSKITGNPIYRVRVAFAEVLRNEDTAIFVDDAGLTPFVETDRSGRFVMPDLLPKEYVIVIGDPFGPNDVVRNDDGLPRIWNIEAGQQIDIGIVQVNIGN